MDADFKKKYGKYIKTGDKLLAKRKDYKILKVSPALDIALGGGIKEGSWVMISGDPKKGKALSLDSLVYTYSGPKQMRYIEVGDRILTPCGSGAEVTGVYPQGKQPTYKVSFDDNTNVECSVDHLWTIWDDDGHETITLKEIMDRQIYPNLPAISVQLEYLQNHQLEYPENLWASGRYLSSNGRYYSYKKIIGYEYVGEKECQCISIDHSSGLFLTDGFTPTHNTTIVMQIIKNAQEEGRPIMYLNVEGRLKEMNFEVEGLDPAKMIIVEAEDKPLSAETYFDIARAFIEDPENEGGVLIIDSLSSLIPAKDLDEDISGMTRPGLPKVISDFCKKLGQIVPNQRSFIIAITHMITNTSGYGKSKNPDGGVKIQFQADTRLEVKSSAAWEAGSEKIGIKTVWEILASSVGAPYKTAETWIRFGKGIDKVQEIIILACELGLISKSGSWYYLDFLPESEEGRIKFQGQEKIHDYLSSHPEHYKVLEEKLKEIL